MNSLLDRLYTGRPSHLIKMGICVFTAAVCAAVNAFSDDPSEAAREWDEKWDKEDILFSEEMRRDSSESFLQVPENIEPEDFSVAATVPEVDFAIVQGLEPFHLPAPHPLETEDGRRDTGNWGGWGPVTRGPEGNFYFSIGNHRAYQSDVYIIQYDPAARSQKALLSTRDIIGWEPDQYGASKQHGFIDVAPDGEMWLLTMNSPRPNERELEEDYRGCWLVRYNVEEGEGENMGVPLEGDTWPYHAWDWERDLLFAVGNKYVMAYDTAEQRLLYGGAPPYGVRWFHRVTMLDRETGVVYGTEMHRESHPDYRREESTEEHRFISYQRRNNEFTIMDAAVPPNPETGRIGPVRAHTREKDSDGAFWCFDYYGTLFRFYPEEDRTSEALGASWGEEGRYTTDIAMSPDERYLYFTPVGAGSIGLPVIQYDTETGEKKVLAFLSQFYRDEYNYAVNRVYGMEIDEKGESLFFFTDGHFAPPKDEADDYSRPRLTRRPAMFHFFIPEEERRQQELKADSEVINKSGEGQQKPWDDKMSAYYTEGKITIDGKLDEPAWENSFVVDGFHTWVDGELQKADHQTEVRILWDDENLYIGAVMEDKDVYAHQTDKKRTFEGDVFEVFIKPFADKPYYFEFHVTALNLRRQLFWRDREEMTPSEADYEGGMQSAVEIRGELNNHEVVDEGWTVEIALPFSAFKDVAPPPEAGTEWRAAFCRYSYSRYLPENYERPAMRLPEDSPRARELSSSVPFSAPRFHLTDEYERLVFDK